MSDIVKGMPALAWYGLALVLGTVVILLNNGPLYYFDTAGYIAQGVSILKTLGISVPAPEGAGLGSADAAEDGVVTGSRAAVYSFLMAVTQRFFGITTLAIFQAVALIGAVWVVVRGAVRAVGGEVAPTVGLLFLAGSLGTLPVITTYLMPDIFAPILLLSIAALTVFFAVLSPLELLVALGLGALAVVTHPSHLAMAVLMVPVAALTAFLLRQPRWWVAVILVALIPAFGVVERLAFTTAAKTVKQSEVIYQPFLTVRAIVDGPGYAYLADHCPDEGIATCALYEALQQSDNPRRLTASHIMFERDPELGSYQFLDTGTQQAIAEEQMRFFLSVALARPVGMTLAFLGNTLEQANKNDISLAIPSPTVLRQIEDMTAYAPEVFAGARALGGRGWIEPLTMVQQGVYVISLLVIVGMMAVVREKPPLVVRALVLMVLAGIFVNAFVCGGVSQPSDRYGARVIFLLPMAAALLLVFRRGEPRLR